VPGEFLLKSGDLFRQDAEGDFYFVARGDEIIKSRGEKVSPAEVENAIYSLPAVREAVVAGIPDPLLGEAVCAFVTPREGHCLDVQQIKRACSERLENYMVPKHVLLVAGLPHTVSGKLSRKLVLEQYATLIATIVLI
jgi:acyl-coenzyme A synthetase/AMP-(fatty) acid ligase